MSKDTKKNKKRRGLKTRKKRKVHANNDFYYFVNKSWLNNNFISKNTGNKSSFTILDNKIKTQLSNLLTKHIFKTNNYASKQCKDLYNSINTFHDSRVEIHVYSFINQLNNFRKVSTDKSLYEFLAWTRYIGISTPISVDMVNNNQHHGKSILELQEDGVSFMVKDMYIDPKNRKLIVEYTEFVKNAFGIFFGENNMYCAEDVVDIETSLASKFYTQEKNLEVSKNKFSSRKIKQKCGFDFHEYITNLGFTNISGSYKVSVSNPEYIKHASKLMSTEWTTNKWNSYWVFRLLVFVSAFHSKLDNHFFNFFSLKLNGIIQMKPRHIIAVNFVSNVMNNIVSRKYIEYHKNEKQRELVIDITKQISRAFKVRITGNQWMSNETKEVALKKIDSMIWTIGYKDKFVPDPDCDFDETDAIENIIMLVKWKINYIIKNIHKKIPDKSYWIHNGLNVFDVNASYNFSTNEMTIPNAILQPPYVELDKGMTYNLANIGFTIAHEMVHAFDKNGCQYDDTGEIRNWWNKEDDKNYKKLQEEVVEQYETMSKRDNIKLNGKLVLSENIADISALQVIEDVLEQQLIEKDIFGPKQNSYFKELYYNYAKQWRELINKKNLNQLVMIDPHSLSKYRVNCTLIRSKRFRQIFNIKPGDNMYYDNPMNELW